MENVGIGHYRIEKRAGLAFAIVCVLMAYAGIASATADYAQSAQRFLSQGKNRAAVIQLKNALQANPNDAQARLLLGTTYLKLGQSADAEKELRRARALGVARSKWIRPLGTAYLDRGNAKAVLDEIKEDAKDSSNVHAIVLALRARAELMRGNNDLAQSSIQQALKLSDTDADVLLAAAQIAMVQKDRAAAAAYVRKAMLVAPERVEPLVLHGELLLSDGKLKDALQAFSKAVSINPGHVGARLAQLSTMLALGQYSEAKNALEWLNQHVPGHPLVQYFNAVLAFQNKDYDTARSNLELALRSAPNYAPARLLAGAVAYAQGRLESAEDDLSRYLVVRPGYLPASKLLAAVRLKRRDPNAALALLTPLERAAPQDAQLLALIGSAYYQKRDFARGTEYLSKAAKLAPDMAAIRMQLGVGNLALGKTSQAVSDLQAAVDMGSAPVQADVLLILVEIQRRHFDKALTLGEAMAKRHADSPVAQNLLAAAYIGKGDRTQARAHLNKALELDPKYITAYINLAKMAEKDHKPDAARAQYELALKQKPGNMGALLGLAALEERSGKPDEARALVIKARDANPNAIEPGVLLTRYYLANGDGLKGLSAARQLADAHPNNPGALKLLGDAQLAAGETASAVITFKRLADMQPKNIGAQLLVARAYIAQKDRDQARKTIAAVVREQPKNIAALAMLSDLELNDGNNDEATALARKIQQLDSKSGIGYQLQGNVQHKAKQYAAAAHSYQQAFDRTPSSWLAASLAQSLQRSNDPAGAISVLVDWCAKQPKDSGARIILAQLYQSQNQIDAALREYDKVRQAQPDNAAIWNNMAWLYLQRSDARASEYAAKAYALAPKSPAIADTYGWILLKNGKPKQALQLLQTAASHSPNTAEIRYHLAAALEQNGQRDEARKELTRLLRSDAQFAEADDARALLARIK